MRKGFTQLEKGTDMFGGKSCWTNGGSMPQLLNIVSRKSSLTGFTLIELLVAVSIMALMIVFTGMVFRVSIDMYRASAATGEIMQKFRAVTDQLDADFKGLRRDAPVLLWFQQPNNDVNDSHRFDQIMFFAAGDFQSIQTYGGTPLIPNPNGTTVVRGNVARIFYGHAQVNNVLPWSQKNVKQRILARRQHILDPCDTKADVWPQLDLTSRPTGFGDSYSDPDGKQQIKEERYEHDSLSLAQWKTIKASDYDFGSVINTSILNRPTIDTSDSRTFHKLLCEGVGGFAIQWAYWDNTHKRFDWFPSSVPDISGAVTSHFITLGIKFGIYFNIPTNNAGEIPNFKTVKYDNISYGTGQFANDFFPTALKFTFTLYDSKGVIRDGMTFSHIVYLEK